MKNVLKEQGQVTAVGDEGGFAPNLEDNEAPLKCIVEAIKRAGYEPGKDICIAMDVAASEFYNKETKMYDLVKSHGGSKTTDEMISWYEELVNKYPIVSIEDGLGLETAGGIIKALDFFDDEPFLVINADIFLDCDYGLFAQYQLQSKYYAHLFLVKNPQHNLKGDFAIAEDGHLITGNAYTFSGVGIYTKQAFFNLAVQRLALRPIFDKLINLNKVSAKYIDIPWFDVGSIDRLETLNNYLKNKN